MKITTKIHFIILFIMIYPSQSPAQWFVKNMTYHYTVESFTAQGTEIFAGLSGDGVIRSTDGGETWNQVNTGLSNLDVRTIISVPYGKNAPYLVVGTWGAGVFRSYDNGSYWADVSTGLPNLFISSLATGILHGEGYASAVTLAGTWDGYLFLSSDNELNWRDITATGVWSDTHIRSLLIDDSCIFVGEINKLFRVSLSDFGHSVLWSLDQLLTNTTITALVKGGGDLFAGTAGSGIFRSSNKGADWVAVNTGLRNLNIAALVVSSVSSGTIIVAATWGDGVYYTINNGASWIEANEGGMACCEVRSLLVFNNFLFAGNDDGTIWRRPLSDFATTDVRSTDNQIAPKDFSLSQNYPNPFNPTTTIEYQVPVAGNVQIVVYDLLGRAVSVLLDERKNSGSYKVIWDGSHLSSGIYICRMMVTGQSLYRKMILMK